MYRVHEKSISNITKDVSGVVKQWCTALIKGIEHVDQFLSKQKYFRQHTDAKYTVFEVIAHEFVAYLIRVYAQIPPYQLDEIIRAEFAKAKDTTALMTFLFSRMNVFNVNLMRQSKIIQNQQMQIQQLQAQLQQRQ